MLGESGVWPRLVTPQAPGRGRRITGSPSQVELHYNSVVGNRRSWDRKSDSNLTFITFSLWKLNSPKPLWASLIQIKIIKMENSSLNVITGFMLVNLWPSGSCVHVCRRNDLESLRRLPNLHGVPRGSSVLLKCSFQLPLPALGEDSAVDSHRPGKSKKFYRSQEIWYLLTYHCV